MVSAVESQQAKIQIMQMTQFILNEAKDKAEEIESKALQDFNIEKLKLEFESKEKIRHDYQRKLRQLDSQNAIARSSAINKSRLDKIKCRQETVGRVSDDAKVALVKQIKSESVAKPFITKLVTQGLLMLLEDEVQVRCRECDVALVQSCLSTAAKDYSKIVKTETGVTKECKVTLDTQIKLPKAPEHCNGGASCLGGVVLACQKGSITIDNTIDARLKLVFEQAKPVIRELLFTK